MDMIDEEIMRLKNRMSELTHRIIPEFENKTTAMYAQIMALPKGSVERERQEAEYTRMSGELRMRSDELINIRQQIENLEMQKSMR